MSYSPSGEPYRSAILRTLPRLLSRIDRDSTSPSAGCCDRLYWAWKFTDFPGPRYQEAVCALAYVYATDLPGNPYCRNRNVLAWIELALAYWQSLQHSDGSFDEAYPFERSFAATAFTTFYVAEALHFLGEHLSAAGRARARKAIERAARWLVTGDETHGVLSNHLAAAVAALVHAELLTGDATFGGRSALFLDRILAHQSSEGWYEEYGGADFGYQTHGSFYLARVQELAPQPRLAESLARAVHFQGLFIHPDRSLGGEYASRHTQTYYPAAFEMLAGHDHAAAWIATTMQATIEDPATAGVLAVDAPNLCPMLNNLVFAHRACQATERRIVDPREPGEAESFIWLPEAGMARVRQSHYVAYVGTSNGGVVKVFDRGRRHLAFSDCGYVAVQSGGQRVATQHFDRGRAVQASPHAIDLVATFARTTRPVMTPWLFAAFRLFTLTVGRSPRVARWLKGRLVAVLVYRKRKVEAAMRRTIEFGDDTVTVRDQLEGPALSTLTDLQWMPTFTSIHMGSSRYFVANELADAEEHRRPGGEPAADSLAFERTVRFG